MTAKEAIRELKIVRNYCNAKSIPAIDYAIRDLREKCGKKGLDFDIENEKYLVKKAEKEQRKAQKERKKAQKQKKA